MKITLPQIKKIAKYITADAKNIYHAQNMKHSNVLDIMAKALGKDTFSKLSASFKEESSNASELHMLYLALYSQKGDEIRRIYIGTFDNIDKAYEFIPVFISNVQTYLSRFEIRPSEIEDISYYFEGDNRNAFIMEFGHESPIGFTLDDINYGYNSEYYTEKFSQINNYPTPSSLELLKSRTKDIVQLMLSYSIRHKPYSGDSNNIFENMLNLEHISKVMNEIELNSFDMIISIAKSKYAIEQKKADILFDRHRFGVFLAICTLIKNNYDMSDESGIINKSIKDLQAEFGYMERIISARIENLQRGETLVVIVPDDEINFSVKSVENQIPIEILSPIKKVLGTSKNIDLVMSQSRAVLNKVFLVTTHSKMSTYEKDSMSRVLSNSIVLDFS